MGFETIMVGDYRGVSARDAYPDDLRSKTELMRLVDLNTLVPALTIIETHSSPRRVRRIANTKNRSVYFSRAEICDWGKEHGYDFCEMDEIDPLWISYCRLIDRLQRGVSELKTVEESLGFTGDELNYPSFRQLVCKPKVRLSKAEDIPSREEDRLPIDLCKEDLQIRQIRAFVTRLNAEFRTVTSHNKELRKQAKEDHDIIEILNKKVQAAEGSAPGVIGPDKKRLRRAHVNVATMDMNVVENSTVEGFETILPREVLISHLRPTPLKEVSGVYFLMNDADEIVYVGQSTNVAARVGQHCIDKSKRPHFTKVAAVSVPKSKLLSIEGQYIAAYSPMLNGTTEEKLADRRLVRLQTKKSRRWKRKATTGVVQRRSSMPSEMSI